MGGSPIRMPMLVCPGCGETFGFEVKDDGEYPIERHYRECDGEWGDSGFAETWLASSLAEYVEPRWNDNWREFVLI